jgi:hypothetical protein
MGYEPPSRAKILAIYVAIMAASITAGAAIAWAIIVFVRGS